MDKYFGDTANVKLGRFTASATHLFRASRPGYEKTLNSISNFQRVLIQILSGHILELILTEIFYGFLNIYKILWILREQNIVKFQGPKITSDT